LEIDLLGQLQDVIDFDFEVAPVLFAARGAATTRPTTFASLCDLERPGSARLLHWSVSGRRLIGGHAWINDGLLCFVEERS
jgi:hypothetical protein